MSNRLVATGLATAAAVVAAAALSASAALASSTPVGPLPKGPVFQVKVLRDATFVIRAPKRPANSGLVWRVARQFDSKVVRQVGEGEDRLTVWLRFKAVGAGKTRIVLALTRGETRKAYAARTWAVAARQPAMS
jgi:hypothetical protein